MPFIKEVVDYINTSLQSDKLSASVYKTKLMGIAQTGIREDDNFPMIVDSNGQGVFEAFNDAYNLVIYHRCLSSNYTVDVDKGFGDNNANMIEEASMKMVVWGNRNSLNLTQEQLFFQIISGITNNPARSYFTQNGLNQPPIISIGAVTNNSQDVFNSEFKINGVSYPIKPEHIYFSINYSITTHYAASCTDGCAEC